MKTFLEEMVSLAQKIGLATQPRRQNARVRSRMHVRSLTVVPVLSLPVILGADWYELRVSEEASLP